MDNENRNDLEVTDTAEETVVENEAVTADDLIARLKSNLKIGADFAAEETAEEAVEAAEQEDAQEAGEELSAIDIVRAEIKTLEEAGELISEDKKERNTSVTDTIKSLIASLNEEEQAAAGASAEVEAGEGLEVADEAVEAVEAVEETSEDEETAVYEVEEKPAKKSRKRKKSEEEGSQAVAQAEQLTFSMTEDDVQKSIEEAQAFIFEREHISNPEDIINTVEETVEATSEEGTSEEKPEYDQTDLWIASAFGDEGELKEKYGEQEAKKIEDQLDSDADEYFNTEKEAVKTVKLTEEYTSRSQAKEIFTAYRRQHKMSLIKLSACFVILLVALIYENIVAFGGTRPGALNQHNYPVVYILGSLQLFVLACGIAWEQIYTGVRALLVMKPLPESITAVVAVASVVYHLAHCFISETDPSVSLYMFPAMLCVFVTLVFDFLNLKREIFSFNIVSSKKMKYVINHVDSENAGLENEAFGDYLSEEEDVSMFKIGKTGFVNGFYDRMNSYSKSNSFVTVLVSVAIALGLVFFIVATVVHDVKTAFSFGYLAFILSIPCCSILSFALPFYRASKKAFDDGSAIIGEISLDEYAHANTLSFDDKDVFPSYGVRVKSIKVFGDNRIDMVLYNSASVFKKIGGPLADVFDTATHELGISEDMEIIEIAKDGIESLIDGRHVYVGKSSYIKAKGYVPAAEPEDDDLETSGEASIMYMVTDDVLAAKMYVQYTIDPDFEYALRSLYKAGICIGIKTFDPNVDDKLLGSKVKITKYPVRILRCKSLEEATSTQEEADSGVVSKNGPRSLLSAFVLCSKVLLANKTNITVKVLSVAFSVVLMAFFLIFGKIVAIPSLFVALYQAFWMVPVFLISRFHV